MAIVERSGEVLARIIDRRRFLDVAAKGIFGAVAAGAAGLLNVQFAEAQTCAVGPIKIGVFACSPSNGIYCDSINAGYCSGSSCAGGCTWDTSTYPTACWCTQAKCYGCVHGYYQCCDCKCFGRFCSCHTFIDDGLTCVGCQRPAKAA